MIYRKILCSKLVRSAKKRPVRDAQPHKFFVRSTGFGGTPTSGSRASVNTLALLAILHDGTIMPKMNVPPPGGTFILLVGETFPNPL